MQCDTLSFAVSYRCNLACGHCCVHSSPERSGACLQSTQMIETIDAFVETRSLRRVVFTGGEPTLFGAQILPVVSHCTSQGIQTRLVSNASWATSEHAARRKVAPYAEAGLTEFAFSWSHYHLAYFPRERYLHAVQASLAAGIKVQMLLVLRQEDEADQEAIQAPFADFSSKMLHWEIARVVPVGRAADLPKEAFSWMPLQDVERGGCGMLLRPIVINNEGDVAACCGFPYNAAEELRLGALEEGLEQLLRQARRNKLLRWIHAVGPWRILEIVHPEKYHAQTRVAGGHICQGCQLLFSEEETRTRLHRYIEQRGERLLFEECMETFGVVEELPLAPEEAKP